MNDVTYYEKDGNLYRLTVSDSAVLEDAWRDGGWVDVSPVLVGWIVEGEASPITEQEAQSIDHSV